MIDRYSFLNLEELTEQRRHIKKKKKVSKTMRGKMGCGGGGGWQRWGSQRQKSEQRGRRRSGRALKEENDTGGASGRKIEAEVSFN